MNPVSNEYKGRSKLPNNLKQLFRQVSMTKPNIILIGKILLYSNGFKYSNLWSNKLCQLYLLSNQLLSKQKHYDWGLRALKTIFNSCSKSLKQLKLFKKTQINKNDELNILLKSLKINTLSKLTFNDSKRFDNLLNDVFFHDNNIKDIITNDDNDESFEVKLKNTIECELKENNDELVDNQLKKILQLYEALTQRMGVVIVGPSKSGIFIVFITLY